MDSKINGIHAGPSERHTYNATTNGYPQQDSNHNIPQGSDGEPSQEEIENELPVVFENQVPLGDLLSRTMQAIYAELTEIAETLPGMSDVARKRTIADWVVKTKKQVVKLYAVARWARDAKDVQKAMNITAFLMEQNKQFEDAVNAITTAKENLATAKLRNFDLLTSLDVLTTGSYHRLPTQIKKFFTTPQPLTDEDVKKTLYDMEEHIRYRLRMQEIIPIEMSHYKIDDGRVFFTAPNLFQTSISLKGARPSDGWFFVHVEFLFVVGGDPNDVQDFPRRPTGDLKRHITVEADNRLGYYIPNQLDPNIPPEFQPPPRPELPVGVVDTPLVRLFNFLQMMSLSYQLEILFFQAQRMRALGWRDYLGIERSNDGKSFSVSYWIRPTPKQPARPQFSQRQQVAPFGGKLIFSIVETHASAKVGGGPSRSPHNRILAHLQRETRLGGKRPSDEVETFRFEVAWEPSKNALGVDITSEIARRFKKLEVEPQNLDFEKTLRTAIGNHVFALLHYYEHQLIEGPYRSIFAYSGEVILTTEDNFAALRVHLCADEYLTVSIDSRTGRFTLKDTGGLSVSGRAPRYAVLSDRINDNPFLIYDVLVQARYSTIVELAEQKVIYMGLQSYRTRNLSREELLKFGNDIRGTLFISLAGSRRHYLVLLISGHEFRFALISVVKNTRSPIDELVLEDIGWLDVQRIHGDPIVSELNPGSQDPSRHLGVYDSGLGIDRFKLESEVLRELYAYCCARVAYTNVEMQLKMRSIPCLYTPPALSTASQPELQYLRPSLVRSLPDLCVQTSDLLAGVPAAEAAMSNIRIVPLNWWTTKKTQVVTCVKLKYVQQPVGKRAGTSTVIRPSKNIIYDTREAIVSFLSDDVDNCVQEFLTEWANVSKMVVIAREVSQMASRYSWHDVRLLSFDLQSVEFVYAKDYTVSLKSMNTSGGSSAYELSFSRVCSRIRPTSLSVPLDHQGQEGLYNPHEDARQYFQRILRLGPLLSASFHQLVEVLRGTLPIVCTISTLQERAESGVDLEARKIGVRHVSKAAGWYRILYGDMRYALDLRLMKTQRVLVLDASLPLSSKTPREVSRTATSASKNGKLGSQDKLTGKPGLTNDSLIPQKRYVGTFEPIPDFSVILEDTIRVCRKEKQSASIDMRVVQVDRGLICDVNAVHVYVSQIHAFILKKLTSINTIK